MSGISDAVLEELLDVNKAMAASLSAMANQRGAGGGGGGPRPDTGPAGVAIGLFTKSVGFAAGIMTGTFSHALNIASAGLGTLTSVGKTLIQNQMSLSEGAIAGTNSLSSLTAGLSNLPFGLGLVAQAMTYQTKVLEQNVKTYQDLSQTGATLGGNLEQVRTSAKNMGLSMDEFANVMKNNAPYLLNFGATANEGAAAMIKFNSTMIKGDTGKQLLSMGYSLEEANNMLGMYSASMGGVAEGQLKNQKSSEASVKAFAEELSLSAELQGKTRQQAEDELKERQKNAVRENLLSTMNAEQKQAFYQAENRALAMGGKGAADALLGSVAGIKTPLTKEAAELAAVNRKTFDEAGKMGDIVNNSAMSAAERQKGIDESYGRGAKSMADMADKYGKTGTIIALQGGKMSDVMMAGQRASAQAHEKGLKTEKDYVDQIGKIRDDQSKAEKSSVGTTVQAQARAKYAGDLMDMLSKALEPLFPVITGLLHAFTEFAPKIIGFGGDIIKKFIVPLFKDIFGGMKLDDIIKPFKDFFSGLFGGGGMDLAGAEKGVASFLKPMIKFIGDTAKAIDWVAVGAAFRITFQTVGNFIMTISKVIGNLFGGAGGGAGFGKVLQESFGKLMHGINSLLSGVEFVSKLVGQSPLMNTLKLAFGKVFDLLSSLVDMVVAIVESPVGKFLINQLLTEFNFMAEIFNAIVDAVTGVVDVITGIFKFITGDFKGGFDLIGKGLGEIFNAIVEAIMADINYIVNMVKIELVAIRDIIVNLFNGIVEGVEDIWHGLVEFVEGGWKDALNSLIDVIKGIYSSVVDGIKHLGSGIVDYFTGKDVDKDKQQAQAQQTPQQPAKAPQPVQPKPAQPKQAQPQSPKQQSVSAAKAAIDEKAHKANQQAEAKAKAERAAEQAKAAAAQQTERNAAAANSNDPVEMLRAEIETLNNSIRMLQRSMADTADNTKKTATILASGGNLFKR